MFHYQSSSRYCGYCRRQVYAVHVHRDSGVHLLVALVTCGLWFPVYLWRLAVGGYRCTHCGSWV